MTVELLSCKQLPIDVPEEVITQHLSYGVDKEALAIAALTNEHWEDLG